MISRHKHAGYIALTSALIIAILLAVITLSGGTGVLLARFDTLDYENHLQARDEALSCLYAAAFSLSSDPTYRVPSNGTDIFIGDSAHSCHIVSISLSILDVTVISTATVRTASVRIEGHINLPHAPGIPTIKSWKEMNEI